MTTSKKDTGRLRNITKDTYKKKLSGLSKDVLWDMEAVVFRIYYDNYYKPSVEGMTVPVLGKLARLVLDNGRLQAIHEHIRGEWQIVDKNNEGIINKGNLERILSVIASLRKGTESNIKILEKKTGLFFKINNKQKLYFISDDLKSRKSKLIKNLSNPSFNTFKTIESVFESIKQQEKDKDVRTIDQKKTVIRNTFKEVQRGLSGDGAPISLKLEWNNFSVALVVKSGE